MEITHLSFSLAHSLFDISLYNANRVLCIIYKLIYTSTGVKDEKYAILLYFPTSA